MYNRDKLREEFGEWLRVNWDERETLDVDEWWLSKLDTALLEKVEEIRKEIEETSNSLFKSYYIDQSIPVNQNSNKPIIGNAHFIALLVDSLPSLSIKPKE